VGGLRSWRGALCCGSQHSHPRLTRVGRTQWYHRSSAQLHSSSSRHHRQLCTNCGREATSRRQPHPLVPCFGLTVSRLACCFGAQSPGPAQLLLPHAASFSTPHLAAAPLAQAHLRRWQRAHNVSEPSSTQHNTCITCSTSQPHVSAPSAASESLPGGSGTLRCSGLLSGLTAIASASMWRSSAVASCTGGRAERVWRAFRVHTW
jgi:hypothetical protein